MEVIRGELPARRASMIYGQGGVGKTTFAASFPEPLFIQGEQGSSQLENCARFPVPETWSDVLVQVRSAPATGCKTLVIDTLDGCERLLWQEVCREGKAKSIETVGGGFGKGVARSAEKLKNELLPALDECLAKGVAVLLLSHCVIKRHNDPSGASYDRWAPAMAQAAWGAAYVWADNVLFAELEVVTSAESEGGKAIVTGRRVLRTTQTGGFLAKNRRGMPPTIDMPKSDGYAALADYFRTYAELRAELNTLSPDARIASVTDRDLLVQLIRKAKKNAK